MSSRDDQDRELIDAQIALVSLYEDVAAKGRRIIIVMEGRDAAGKDGTIRRITDNLPSRPIRVISLAPPNERERSSWYFQRYIAHFPAGGEISIFNRSWYNRAGVEPVMGFCKPEQTEHFLKIVPDFERLLVNGGFELVKYYLDISKKEQKERLDERAADPLKVWKIGPLDAKAMEKFEDYSRARDEMLARTHTEFAPWTIVRADKKSRARVNVIRDIIAKLAPDQVKKAGAVEPGVLRPFEVAALKDGFLSH